VTGKVIEFPDPRGAATTEEERSEGLARLHIRLSAALAKDRKQIDLIRVVLSIDDVMQLCQMIEDKLGPDFFDND